MLVYWRCVGEMSAEQANPLRLCMECSPLLETPISNDVWPASSTANSPPLLPTPLQLPSPAFSSISNTLTPPAELGVPADVSFVTKNRGRDVWLLPEQTAMDTAKRSEDGKTKVGGLGRECGVMEDKALRESGCVATRAANSRQSSGSRNIAAGST